MFYLLRAPLWMQKVYPNRTWKMPSGEKTLYLTFDDGPNPIITPQVLTMLKEYNAKGTFFCIGENVKENPNTYLQIISEGHVVGNHSQHHYNGYKTDDEVYLDDIAEAMKYIGSNLYRPPYGKMTSFQASQLKGKRFDMNIVMWTLVSGDFDPKITKEKCADNVLLRAKDGDIIVFHDSNKASENMLYALQKTLEYFSKEGYQFKALTALQT